MLEVYCYNAGKGDCVRVRFAGHHNIIIDTGVIRFAPRFKQIINGICAAGESLDALILTHVDDDHIGGLLSNLRDNNYKCPFDEVWMNVSGASTSQDAILSTRQNNEVYMHLIRRGVNVKPMLRGERRLVAGAIIETVWPENIPANSMPIVHQDIPLAHHNDYHLPLSILAQLPIKNCDLSISNKNSIVFTFEYDGHRLLFTGDAWAEDVVRADGDYDLVKLPHHGSVRNISEEYRPKIRSKDFLICTDGINHPDKQTIAKLEDWYGNINIYSPFEWWKNGYFLSEDRSHRINYFGKEGLVITW